MSSEKIYMQFAHIQRLGYSVILAVGVLFQGLRLFAMVIYISY